MFKRIRLRLEFLGSRYCGWQMQSEGRDGSRESLQATVERAIAHIFGRPSERYPVKGCGRTDAGVHAEQFYCQFDYYPERHKRELDLFRLPHALNGVLPEDIRVLEALEVPSNADVVNDILCKTYEYRIFLRGSAPVFLNRQVLFINDGANADKVNLQKLSQALRLFEGRHNFINFAAADFTAKTTERNILKTELEVLEKYGGRLLLLRFCGEGFLKQMVRNMVGTALDVALGHLEIERIEALLQPDKFPDLDRRHAGRCVPPDGLFLKEVVYP